MKRRKFLQSVIAGGVLSSNVLKTAAQTAGKKKLSKIGLQLYTVRKELARDFEETLRKVAAAGIKEVEFVGYFDHSPKETAALLKRLKLAAPSAHIDTKTLRGGLSQAIEAAQTLGHRYLVLGYLPENERKTLDDYKKLAALLDQAGEECRKAQLQFAYHNHDFEFKRIDGEIPYDLILAQTDAENVKCELDLYWITKGGFDPVVYFEKYPGRFPLLHVKDMDATPKRSFTEVGRGTIDFKKIFARAGAAGVEHYFIEQDETPGSPFESIETSLRYLKKLRF